MLKTKLYTVHLKSTLGDTEHCFNTRATVAEAAAAAPPPSKEDGPTAAGPPDTNYISV